MSRVSEIAIKLLAGLFSWFLINTLVFGFVTFDGGVYVLDDNHFMFGWPDSLITQFNINTGKSRLISLKSEIEQLSITDNYILLEAGNKWYAINRQDHEMSEFVSLEALKNTLKLEDNIRFTTSRPWLRLRFFWPAFFASLSAGVFIFSLLFSREIKRLIFPPKLSGSKAENPI